MKNNILTFCLAIMFTCAWAQQPQHERNYTQVLTSTVRHHGNSVWKMQQASKVTQGSNIISTPQCDTSNWDDAIVPGTVLTSLVNNGVFPDPYYSDNNRLERKLIPDLFHAGRDFYTYWFRTELSFPAETYQGRRTWMQLDGINYRAEVWLNGRQIDFISGMFIQRNIDITDYICIDNPNVLAIKVYPVDSPGTIMDRRAWGAPDEWHNGGDGEIGRNVTMLMSVGWDFTFHDGIRDRNTGIWKDIKIYTTGDVELSYPFVKSALDKPNYDRAHETVQVDIRNTTMETQNVEVTGQIDGTSITFSQPIELLRGEHKEVVFKPEEFPQLIIDNPRLWWPIHKGKQELYGLTLKVTKNGVLADSIHTRFGIREITTDQCTPDSSRTFYVNGRQIFITGTNWIPEAMCQNSVERTYTELRYTAQTGINMIRFWGGGITESEYFYQLCDELGLLLWEEFWLTGDTKHPQDEGLYLQNVESAVKRTRNHPSLAFYVSSNESTEVGGAAALIAKLDGTRGYQMQSECDGIHDGSPYKQVNPMRHYENTASDRGSRVDGFNPEYGAPALSTAECLREVLRPEEQWPINKEVWNYLDGNGFFLMTTLFTDMVNEYGTPQTFEEYAEKAQFVGAMNYKTICEVWRYNKLNYGDRFTSGYLFWCHNSPIRQVTGHMWDWSLEPTSALFATQNATEPLHPQFDYMKNTISVVNDYLEAFQGYKVTADLYDLDAHKLWSQSCTVSLPADGVANDVMTVPFPADISSVHFLRLKLIDNQGKVVGSNFYWRSTNKYEGKKTLTGPTTAGFQAINNLPETKLKVRYNVQQTDDKHLIKLNIRNNTRSVAFFTRIQWIDSEWKPVRPSYYTDNFFSLLPGESQQVEIETSKANLPSGKYTLVVGGFHQAKQQFTIVVP